MAMFSHTAQQSAIYAQLRDAQNLLAEQVEAAAANPSATADLQEAARRLLAAVGQARLCRPLRGVDADRYLVSALNHLGAAAFAATGPVFDPTGTTAKAVTAGLATGATQLQLSENSKD